MKEHQQKQINSWTKQEDESLIYLKESLKLKKWTDISKKLRSDKHCQDRYENFLKRNITKKNWTSQNEKQLIDLYIQYGNKWSQLAMHFEGINGLFIKNKFYSRLRKGMRNINYFINNFFRNQWNQLQFDVLFKLVNCASNKYDYSSRSAIGRKIQQRISFVQQIIYKIFMFSFVEKANVKKEAAQFPQNGFGKEDIEKLIQEVNFIDQKMDKRRSNKIKSAGIEKNIQNQDLIKTSYGIKLERNLSEQQEDQMLPRDENMRNNQHKKIEIITINSYQRILQNWKSSFSCSQQAQSLKDDKNLKRNPSASLKKKRYCSYRQIFSSTDSSPYNIEARQPTLYPIATQQIQENQDKEKNISCKVEIFLKRKFQHIVSCHSSQA